MTLFQVSRSVTFAVAILFFVPTAFAVRPTWARNAVGFPAECDLYSEGDPQHSPRDIRESVRSSRECRPIRVPSPDGKLVIEISYEKQNVKRGFDVLVPSLRLRDKDGSVRDADLQYGFGDDDLQWSPDSKAFFVNGVRLDGSATSGFWVAVYRVDDPKLEPIDLTGEAQLEMVKLFPPCKASEIDKKLCRELVKNPQNNMSGIDWSGDSTRIVVMAEVPEGGGMGGIRGQVMGYELEVPTGKILRRMTAREFKRVWQTSMAFRFHVPDPPQYCEKGNPKNLPGCIGHNW